MLKITVDYLLVIGKGAQENLDNLTKKSHLLGGRVLALGMQVKWE